MVHVILSVMLAVTGFSTSAQADTLSQLGNIEYRGIYEQPVTLSQGRYEGPPFVEGGASRPTLTLIDGLIARGHLSGDGAEEAAVLLVENSGGSGSFVYLAVVREQNGAWRNVATALVGDRVQIRNLSINEGVIVMDTVVAGTGDTAVAPGQKMRTVYAIRNGVLAASESVAQGAVSVADLDNSQWHLRQLNTAQRVSPAISVTAAFSAAQISGSAGCNSYRAGIEDRGNGAIGIGPIMATRKMCPPPEMAVETVFLRQLRAVKRFRFYFSQLALAYDTGDGAGEMLFERAAGN